MSSEDKELFQFRSYQVNLNNPVAISRKYEKEKVIKPQITNLN